jgi:hypothetical protein
VSDDDDRPRDASSAADAGWSDPDRVNTAWAEAVAPDDISELTRDIQAYRREQRATRRRARLQRLAERPWTTPLLFAVAAMSIAALVATMLTLLNPAGGREAASPLPLAHTAVADGQLGGLLPNATLRTDGGAMVSARTLRPTVVALIPLQCDCTSRLASLARDASAERLRLMVVAPTYPDAEAASLPGQLDKVNSAVYYDPTGDLRAAVAADGVTLVLINRDGTVFNVQRDAVSESASTLNTLLQRMLQQPRAGG